MLFIKKIIKKTSFFIFLIIILSSNLAVLADDLEFDTDKGNNISIDLQTVSTEIKDSKLNLNSRSCIAIDRLSQTVLFGKNENNKVKMASTTKIMTALVVIENCPLNKTVEISKKSANIGGSRLGLKTGDKISVLDLLYGLLLCSGNDAAVALAETVGSDVEGFSDLMNKKAQDLNLSNTHFESPHGLDSPRTLHYSL